MAAMFGEHPYKVQLPFHVLLSDLSFRTTFFLAKKKNGNGFHKFKYEPMIEKIDVCVNSTLTILWLT